MTILYNLRHDGDQYRITKFNDAEVESSYLTDGQECDCPAGHRHTCRHRQMLPDLLPIIDSHWFMIFETKQIVDLMGTPKATIDALVAPMVEQTVVEDTKEDTVPAGQHTAAESFTDAQWHDALMGTPKPAWRRT